MDKDADDIEEYEKYLRDLQKEREQVLMNYDSTKTSESLEHLDSKINEVWIVKLMR